MNATAVSLWLHINLPIQATQRWKIKHIETHQVTIVVILGRASDGSRSGRSLKITAVGLSTFWLWMWSWCGMNKNFAYFIGNLKSSLSNVLSQKWRLVHAASVNWISDARQPRKGGTFRRLSRAELLSSAQHGMGAGKSKPDTATGHNNG